MRAMPTTIASTPAPFLRIWSPRSRPSLAFVSHRRISTRVASPIGPDLSPEAVTPASHPDPFPTLAKGAPLPEGYGEPPSAPPKHRRSGIILHPTSLPGPYGIGEIGEEAFRFVDWLVASGQQIWQVGPGSASAVTPCLDGFRLHVSDRPCVLSHAPCMDGVLLPGSPDPAGHQLGSRRPSHEVSSRILPFQPLHPAFHPPFSRPPQLLPLCPPETEYWSPYSGLDALCGNPLLIPLNGLKDLGLLKETDLPVPSPPGDAGLHAPLPSVTMPGDYFMGVAIEPLTQP